MFRHNATIRPFIPLALLLALATLPPRGPAQGLSSGSATRFTLNSDVRVPGVDSSVLAQIERFDALAAERRWSEAIDQLLAVAELPAGRLIPLTPSPATPSPAMGRRYVNVDAYLRLRLVALPAAGLAEYRARIDPVARRWYEQGRDDRDATLLRRVVDEAPASSVADDALLALGEIALERAAFTDARRRWEQILPPTTPHGDGSSAPAVAAPSWPGYPDTDLDPAALRARLVLVSILEGDARRAEMELDRFRQLHPDAVGRFAGREVRYVDALEELLASSRRWPTESDAARDGGDDWPTFARRPERNARVAGVIDPRSVVWRRPLLAQGGRPLPGSGASDTAGPSRSPITELPRFTVAAAARPYFPVVAEGHLFVCDRRHIVGYRLADGEPAWGARDGVVFERPSELLIEGEAGLGDTLGRPHYTMTADDGRLFARLGSHVTVEGQHRAADVAPGVLVCLDLRAEGRLLWQVSPEKITAEPGWAFEGAPLCDTHGVYIGMRRGGVQTESHVACLDPKDGSLRWRTFVAAADTPAGSLLNQATHNLLTQVDRTLFYNTNLGAVASLSADDGSLDWISLYERADGGSLLEMAPHWRRQLNPCVYHRGRLLVAPADSPRIFAFDAATGGRLWRSTTALGEAVHLIGVSDRHVLASGGRLYWIALDGPRRGRIEHHWPDGPAWPGTGRGLIRGDEVLFPMRERIAVFDLETARPRRTIELFPRGTIGGNLLAVGGRLLIATEDEIVALRRR